MSVWSLARDQRRQQNALGGLLVRDLAAAWQAFFGSDTTPPSSSDADAFAGVVSPILRQYGSASATVAADFYARQRESVGELEPFRVPLAEPAPEEQIRQSIGWVLREKALAPAPADPDEDLEDDEDDEPVDLDDPEVLSRNREQELERVGRRLAAQPGRTTLERAIDEDPAAVGWARVTDGNPCHFCAMLAGRGFVYLERDTALYAAGTREPYHDGDGCTVAPRLRSDRSPLPAVNQAYQDLWYVSGAYFTGQDAQNAFRRALAAQRKGGDVEAAVFEGPKTDPNRYRRQVTHDRKTVEAFRREAQRGGTNGTPPDDPRDPRWPSGRRL